MLAGNIAAARLRSADHRPDGVVCDWLLVSTPTTGYGRATSSRELTMLVPGPTSLRPVVAVIVGTMAAAVLFGGASIAFAQPAPTPPPSSSASGCTAGDLAQASGTVGDAMADYLFSHPEVNNFFTSLRGRPDSEIHDDVQNYMNANPQVQSDINGIRQPLTDLRNRCQQ
jgi:hemophore-related protein